jgi:hypothetical protein
LSGGGGVPCLSGDELENRLLVNAKVRNAAAPAAITSNVLLRENCLSFTSWTKLLPIVRGSPDHLLLPPLK